MLSGSSDGTAALFEADTGKELQRITSEGEVNAVAFSHDGGLFAIGSSIKASAVTHGFSISKRDSAFSSIFNFVACFPIFSSIQNKREMTL